MQASFQSLGQMRRLCHATSDKIDRISRKVFVSHYGSYSVERLYALENYCCNTSALRTFLVCSLLSLPALFVSIAIELIPLQSPNKGWRDNYGCWGRLYAMGFVAAFGASLHLNALVPELRMSGSSIFGVSLIATMVNISLVIGLAAFWVFPIPFVIVINAVPFALTLMVCIVSVVGPKRLARGSSLRRQVGRQMYVIAAQSMLMIVYPSFSIAHYWLPHQYKSSFVFLLPMIRIAMQHVVTWAMRDLEEYLPSNVVFSISVFNALYMSKCMQSNASRFTYGIILALDTIQTIQMYRRLRKYMAQIHSLAHKSGLEGFKTDDLLSALVKVSQEPGVLQQMGNTSSVRIRSPIKPQISHQRTMILDQLATIQFQPSSHTDLTAMSLNTHGSSSNGVNQTASVSHILSAARVHPTTPIGHSSPDENVLALALALTPIALKREILLKSLKMLFECEYFMLMAFVKCAVPMIYTIYVAIVGLLPSAEYHPEIHGKTMTQVELMVLNIVVYAWIEVLSFLVLHVLVKRRSGLTPIHLLAFVIENQSQEMLGQLFVWYVILLQLTITHFGKLGAWVLVDVDS